MKPYQKWKRKTSAFVKIYETCFSHQNKWVCNILYISSWQTLKNFSNVLFIAKQWNWIMTKTVVIQELNKQQHTHSRSEMSKLVWVCDCGSVCWELRRLEAVAGGQPAGHSPLLHEYWRRILASGVGCDWKWRKRCTKNSRWFERQLQYSE